MRGGLPIAFEFETLDGKRIDTVSTHGRATAVLFLTTYDLASQVEAQRLEDVLQVHTPRANGFAVVLQTPEYRDIAVVFRESLKLSLPMAMADAATLQGHGSFGRIPKVPTLVVLDRDSREVWRRAGLVTHQEISRALVSASEAGD